MLILIQQNACDVTIIIYQFPSHIRGNGYKINILCPTCFFSGFS